MFVLILRRLLEVVPVLLVIATISFFLIRLAPGGPFSDERHVSAEVLANLNAHYGLDKPLHQQYLSYLGNLLRGDLGPSYHYQNRTVNELIADALPVSAELGLYALLVALLLGLSAGIIASLRPNSRLDYVPMSLAMAGICFPTFVLGPILALVFGLWLGWFNATGWDQPGDRVLPALTLGAFYMAYIARLTRGSMIEILSQDFVRTARAKGLAEKWVVFKHALRVGILPVLSFLGPAVAGLISGSFVVETVFGIPGLGRFFVQSAFNRDSTLLVGVVLFYATLIIFLNLLVDILQGLLNPKVRYE
jgi:oligopeptide transport system permease protein